MALDERYIVASDLEQYFVDKSTGLPLSAGTLSFYRDIARNVAKPVYQLTGSPPNYTYSVMPNPITLSASGTVQNASGDNVVIYYHPYDDDGELDLYYVVCKSSGNEEQFTREAWPNVTADTDPTKDSIPVSNQISNPQFTRVFINEDQATTYSVSGAVNQVFQFAPNWDFVITGTGSVTVQRFPVAGNQLVVTNPPYVLDISVSAGISACYLRQRMNVNSGLWSSTQDNNIFLVTSVTAKNMIIGSASINMFYIESSGGSPVQILNRSVSGSVFVSLPGSSEEPIPVSTDTNLGNKGYVDIYLSFTQNSHIQITSIQVIPTLSSAGADLIQYDTQSSNREQALLGDYYIPRLERKQIKSLLTAWDFPLNPSQFNSLTGSITTTAAYIADQTIALSLVNPVSYARSPQTHGMQYTTTAPNSAFYNLQYLTGIQAKKLIGSRWSINVFGYKGVVGTDVTMRVYLFRSNVAGVIPVLPTVIGLVSTDGTFALSAPSTPNWTAIPRSGLDIPTVKLNTVTTNSDILSSNNDYGFSGWEITDSTHITDTDNFAIVVTFACATTATVITLNSVSVVPGDIPCRPALQTPNEVQAECQYYYRKSFAPGIVPASNVGGGTGETFWVQAAPLNSACVGPTVRFDESMVYAPAVATYNPHAPNGNIRDTANGLDWNTDLTTNTTVNGFYTTGTTPTPSAAGSSCSVHWTADARLAT